LKALAEEWDNDKLIPDITEWNTGGLTKALEVWGINLLDWLSGFKPNELGTFTSALKLLAQSVGDSALVMPFEVEHVKNWGIDIEFNYYFSKNQWKRTFKVVKTEYAGASLRTPPGTELFTSGIALGASSYFTESEALEIGEGSPTRAPRIRNGA